jgi:hypothetical protein
MTDTQTLRALLLMKESQARVFRQAVSILTKHGFDSVDAAMLIMEQRSRRGLLPGGRTGYIPTRESLLAREAEIRTAREADRIQRQTLRETYNYGTDSK